MRLNFRLWGIVESWCLSQWEAGHTILITAFSLVDFVIKRNESFFSSFDLVNRILLRMFFRHVA